jgi:hypothetical protein
MVPARDPNDWRSVLTSDLTSMIQVLPWTGALQMDHFSGMGAGPLAPPRTALRDRQPRQVYTSVGRRDSALLLFHVGSQPSSVLCEVGRRWPPVLSLQGH